ncbi:unnamed protein product [Cladocopium goreaui]|uniref:Uncharacterized protein n=1 Tax=Cladocopium goreaui TaxID=2562237 RepID=A0A9P1DEC3_9DINO|nr:unnamed protein product [Cladocopium goreaui]
MEVPVRPVLQVDDRPEKTLPKETAVDVEVAGSGDSSSGSRSVPSAPRSESGHSSAEEGSLRSATIATALETSED